MFDMSCLYGTNEFSTIQQDAYNTWNANPGMNPFDSGITQQIGNQYNVPVDGQHYFAMLNGNLEAIWDLTSSGPYAGNPGAIVYAHKINTSPSPDGPNNILWVQLAADSGALANTIYRIHTVQGQPPSTVSFSVD